jgi:hypothetical protein
MLLEKNIRHDRLPGVSELPIAEQVHALLPLLDIVGVLTQQHTRQQERLTLHQLLQAIPVRDVGVKRGKQNIIVMLSLCYAMLMECCGSWCGAWGIHAQVDLSLHFLRILSIILQ